MAERINARARAQAKKLVEEDFDVRFNYRKNMTGHLSIFETRIEDEVVYSEPVLVTSEGVLTIHGILGLAPEFTDKPSDIYFMPLEDYSKKTGDYWLKYQRSIWDDVLQAKRDAVIQEKDEYRKEWLRKDLENWNKQEPKSVEVTQKDKLGTVEFVGRWSNDAWLARRRVELTGMESAMEYYRSKGYAVSDVSMENRGYDVLCKRRDGILRVEVKGLKVMPCPQISHNEYLAAEFYKDSFVLFVVRVTNQGIEMYEIFDPVNNIDFTEILRPVYIAKGFENLRYNPELARYTPQG